MDLPRKDTPKRIIPPAEATTSGSMTTSAAQFLKIGIEGAKNTVRSYRADLDCYTSWCDRRGLVPFPAAVEQVSSYISDLAQRYKVATITRRLAMLSTFHELQGFDSPTGSKVVRTTLKGIKRTLGVKQKLAPAFDMEVFRKVILSLDETTNAGLRDKALLLLGFTGAFRRGELAALNTEHLIFDEKGILVDVVQSKTDQLRAGQVKAIFYASDPRLCPVRTLHRYVDHITGASDALSTDASQEVVTTPLFLRMRKGDRYGRERLTDQGVWRIVKHHFGDKFSAHTLRASFVTVAKRNGASDSEIMRQTGQKTPAMIRRYTRFEDAREHNAGTKLGL